MLQATAYETVIGDLKITMDSLSRFIVTARMVTRNHLRPKYASWRVPEDEFVSTCPSTIT